MNRPRRARSPPFGYDSRVVGRAEPRPPSDYDDLYPMEPIPPFEPPQSAPAFVEPPHQQYPVGYRDQRLPSTYRATLREPYLPSTASGSAPYKILCITNINQKVSDGPVKEALTADFSRFGDISVSVCHDSGERLAYIYFRSYEEAREARHTKARTLLFDRPIEIEPIYEPRSSSVDSPPPMQSLPPQPLSLPPPHGYPRRRSITPPDYYSINGPHLHPPPHPSSSIRRLPPGSIAQPRGLSPPPQPPLNYLQRGYPPGPSPPMPPNPMPYGRYYMPAPSHLPPPAPYLSPPHEQYRSYPQPHPGHQFPPHPYHPSSSYGPPRERERGIHETHLASRSPRHEEYYPMDHRGYPPPPPAQHSSRSSLHSSSSHHQHPNLSPNIHHQTSSIRRSPPPPLYTDHPRYASREFRVREKFGREGYNNESEDGKPSRVLFITNIDATKTESDVREVFESFGVIEDIEVKKISSEISSALIKFSSMDCAYKAKTATNGKYLGKLKCRIAYGKVTASRRLWIGGLSSATTMACLEDEFGKFGNIIDLDYISGRPYAYIEYEHANQAQFATYHISGTLAAKAERKIRIEFVDPVERNDNKVNKFDANQQVSDTNSRPRPTNEPWNTSEHEGSPQLNSRKRSITPIDMNPSKRVTQESEACRFETNASIAKLPVSFQADHRPNTINELNNNQRASERVEDFNNGSVSDHETHQVDKTEHNVSSSEARLVQSKSIRDIVDSCSISWFGQLVLRNFIFPSKMFMCSGQKATIEKYITKLNNEDNDDQCPILRITQRWRLHPQPKLEEVKRRMQSGNLGMLIITSRPDQSPIISSPGCKTPQTSSGQTPKENGDKTDTPVGEEKTDPGSDSSTTQTRPLKNLISYLEQKDAAGVISLNALDSMDHSSDSSKLLYAFPPGDFALNLLKRKAPNLMPESSKEEFLLGVIVGSTETKI